MSLIAENDFRDRIVVTGVGGPAGIGATRYLKRKGYSVIGTDMRYITTEADQFYVIPAADHPDFILVLRKIVSENKASLLIPTVSEELPMIAMDKSEITSTGCHVIIASYVAIETANDKLLTAQCLAQRNIAVPRSLDGSFGHQDVMAALGFPLIAKPRISRGGRGVVVINTAKDLVREQRKAIVYQKYIPGQEFDVNLYIDQRGKLKSCVVLAKTLLKDGLVGNALAVERAQRQDVAELGLRACEAIGLTGPADIDIRIDADGTPKLLEINARLGANILSAEEIIEDLLADWKSTAGSKERIS